MSGGNNAGGSTDLIARWDRLSHSVGARYTDGPVYCAAVAEMRSVTPTPVAVDDGESMRAIAPLVSRRVGPVTIARLVGHGLGQGGDIVAADARAAGELADRLARSRQILCLEQVPADSLLLDALRASRRWRVRTRVVSQIPVLTIGSGWTARDVRSRRTVSQLRAARSKYETAGDAVGFELLQTGDDLDRRWDDMRRVAARRADSRPTWDEWLAGDRGDLVRRVLDGEARAGRMRVLGVTVGGRWVGHDIAVRCGTTWARYLTHFDPDHARLQPGHQLMVWIVDHHEELGIDRIHHGRGATTVKKAWSNGDGIDALNVWAVPDAVPAPAVVLALITGVADVRARIVASVGYVARRVLRTS